MVWWILAVGGVDGDRCHAGPAGHLDLVAHEGEQRGDDHGGAVACFSQQLGGDQVDRALASPGALDHQGAAALDGHLFDRLPLVVPEAGVLSGGGGEELLSSFLHDAECDRRL